MKTFVLLVSLMLLISSVFAQSFDERLEQLAEDSGKEYVRPVVTAFGSNLNSGLYNTAATLKPSLLRPIRFGFNFYTMLAMVPESDKTFEITYNPGLPDVDPIDVKTATAFGDKGWKYNGTQIYPDGLNLSVVPLFVPQLRLGLPKGNELMVRYLPPLDMGDFGSLNFWGVGLKHSLDQYIPLFPVHLAVQGAYNSFEVGDLISINSIAVNAHVSKTLLMLTLYGGLGWEDTTLKANYDYINPVTQAEENIKFDIKGDNNLRMTAGFRWALIPFIHINADYTISTYHIITLGLGFQL